MGNLENNRKLKILLVILTISIITTTILNSCSDNKKKIDDSLKIVKNDDVVQTDTNTIEIQEKLEDPEEQEELQNDNLEIDTTELVQIDSLSELVFENGASYHFIDDSCEFYFECDCCSGIYVFNH